MKKLGLLVMPLMGMSLLASCGTSKPVDPKKIDLYLVSYQYKKDKETLISTTTYTYNKNKLLEQSVENFKPVSNNTIVKIVKTYEYDDHENVTLDKEEIYGDDEKLVDTEITEYAYTYDKKGRIEKISITTEHTPKNITIEYIDNQSIVSVYRQSLTEQYVLTYNDKHQLIDFKELHINMNQKSYIGHEYSYDKYGCNTYTEKYLVNDDNTKGDIVGETNTTYLNNLSYRPLKEVSTDVETNLVYTINYTYDDKNRITSFEYNSGNIPEDVIPYVTYEY